LRARACTGVELVAFEKDYMRHSVRGPQMNVQWRATSQCAAVREAAQLHVDPDGRHERSWIGHPFLRDEECSCKNRGEIIRAYFG